MSGAALVRAKPLEGLNREKKPQAVDSQMDDDPRRRVPRSLSDEGDDPGGNQHERDSPPLECVEEGP